MNKETALKYRVPTLKIKMVRDKRGGEPITMNAYASANVLGHNIGDVPYEEVWLLMVNSSVQITGAVKAGQGGINSCALLPRDILLPVVASGCAGFIMGHNHPSGDPTPSNEDIQLTKAITVAAQSLSIPLLDHIIIGYTSQGLRYKSMFELGLM